MKKYFFYLTCVLFVNSTFAQEGYDLWLPYHSLSETSEFPFYKDVLKEVKVASDSETAFIIKNELLLAGDKLLNTTPVFTDKNPTLIISKFGELNKDIVTNLPDGSVINKEGYIIKTITTKKEKQVVITAHTDIGLLYGTFCFIKQLQLHKNIFNLSIIDSPKTQIRILNHWDNLDRTVERGYAGFSIWDWHQLPDYKKQLYYDYARANASVGINGTVLTNVNANALVLTPAYIEKVKALADIFRPYGIKVYLTARFSAPIEIGGLKTADPLDTHVQMWWKDKVKEIYDQIPDFGGFLVKANSEGQPGPNTYGRTHVEGANMLADALQPYGGIVMWRAFVYSEDNPDDRAKQAYTEFVPFDGEFRKNVLVQVKNGAIDFQPREPFHPLFGAMPQTPLMMEFQITQEYLGFSSHLVFLPKLFEETLQADTYTKGKGSTVARIVDGSLYNDGRITGVAGVANIGNDGNWTGHPFGQANWYGFGRLAWNPDLSSETIAQEWLGMSYSTDSTFVKKMVPMLIDSREAVVNYMTPLGLHHIMGAGHHYGPGPWVSNMPRADWTSVYYHKADAIGIGFNRSSTGTKALDQYAPEIQKEYDNIETIPEKYLLWFHHVPWDYQMKNGNSLWYNLAEHYQTGVDQVQKMKTTWQEVKPFVKESKLFSETEMLLNIQLKEAQWWRNACLRYFQQFSKMEFPEFIPEIPHDLNYYQSLKFPYAPGIRPSWN